ncbi:hypothetical protein B9G98_03692 [Wickerhamiella sorbophila]|uniref:Uncharacterized protein n=1 Tax=Wickerhamiella sorbophila TaxID=45607 RepID=A0A2T0FM60_9ASCO|nr:hypothetical protein B9G98_03692 [Wickerhamiella sorbophila]PRT56072.1 hypothetical protein B9G98_03692 [Wickerhamiella sorbophila]
MEVDFFPVYCSVCDKQLSDSSSGLYCSRQCEQADSSPRLSRKNSAGLTTISATLHYPSVLSCNKPNCQCGANDAPLVPELGLSPSDDEMSDYSLPPSPEIYPANDSTTQKPLPTVEYFSLSSSPLNQTTHFSL